MSGTETAYTPSLIERVIFENRLAIILLSLIVTLFLAYRARCRPWIANAQAGRPR